MHQQLSHHHFWFWPFHLALLVVVWIVWIVPLYRILGRAGFPPALAFVALFPPAGMVVLWVIAFSEWKTGGTRGSSGNE